MGSPPREKRYPSGTKQTTVRTTVRRVLLRLAPTAWKKAGKMSEVTRGKKLAPVKRKPTMPMRMTSGSEVKTESI